MDEPMDLFLWKGLTAEEKADCRASLSPVPTAFRKGETVFAPGTPRRALAWIWQGEVQVTHKRVVMNRLGAGDVVGVASLFGEEDYPSTVTAVSPCRILFIEQSAVSEWMERFPLVGENYVRFLSDKIRFLNRRIVTLTVGQTGDKLWRYLCAHRQENRAVLPKGGMTALAKTLDMGRSSLYRCMEELERQGKIVRQGNAVLFPEKEEKNQ